MTQASPNTPNTDAWELESDSNLCKLCGKAPIGSNGKICDECMKKATYQQKAGLILEDSGSEDWGLTFLSPGTMGPATVPADSELVGHWHKHENGTIWITLTTPLGALKDRAILLTAEVARSRKEGTHPSTQTPVQPKQPKRTKTSKPKQKQEQEPDTQQQEADNSAEYRSLRDKLKSIGSR